MKGIVFVELLEMAEAAMGEGVVDRIIAASDLPSGGAYSAVGNYPCAELMTLVQAFSAHLDQPQDALQRHFGQWMHARFVSAYPAFFTDKPDALAMLAAIEDEVHVEVRKLYPEAELPSFDTERLGPDSLRMTYRSPRPLGDFCEGLIEGCVAHFGREGTITRKDIQRPQAGSPGPTVTEFTITLGP